MLRIKKKKKKNPSFPLGLLYDKEAYKMSYRCVRLIMNIWKKKKQHWGKTRPLLDWTFMGFGANIKRV